jgi:hypothetical protein
MAAVVSLPAAAQFTPTAVRIWDGEPHSAFTDLTWYRGQFYCVFRVASKHVSPDGRIRVLTSRDGVAWTSATVLEMEGADLRDPKIMPGPRGGLLISGAAAYPPGGAVRHQTFVWSSEDGQGWGKPRPVGEADYWLWKIAYHDGSLWSAGYATAGQEPCIQLFRDFQAVEGFEIPPDRPNEVALASTPDGSLHLLMRRDTGAKTALLVSRSRQGKWTTRDVGVRIGGPALLALADGKLLGAGRLYDPGTRTAVFEIDPATGKYRELAILPSGGDTSYPGLVLRDGKLHVSYYSSHEGRTAIYFATVKIEEVLERRASAATTGR